MKDTGVGAGTRSTLNIRGQSLIAAHRVKTAKGCRAKGGGRHDSFKIFKQTLKAWLLMERRNGHVVDASDLLSQFAWFLKKAVEHGTKLEAAEQLSSKGKLNLMEYRHRLVKLGGIDYCKWYKKELMKACECRFLKPQRQLKLAYGEEAVRCKLTWQMLDRRIWDLAFGGTEVLKRFIVKPEDAVGNLEHAVIGFSDQVPWWGMVKQGKQLYMKHEYDQSEV